MKKLSHPLIETDNANAHKYEIVFWSWIGIATLIVCALLAGCTVEDSYESKLSKMKSPVIVISTSDGGYPVIVVRDSIGNVAIMNCDCFDELHRGDTIK